MNKFLKRSKKKRKRKNKLRKITKVKKGGFMCRHNRNICFGKNIIFYKETVKELIKMYNSFDSDILNSEDIIHEPYQNITYEPSGLLVGDLTFHGVILY